MDSISTEETSTEESEVDSDDERALKRNLVTAVEKNNFKTLKKLIHNNKDRTPSFVDTRDSTDKNNTLLHIAIRTRKRKLQDENTNIIRLLLQNGANVEATNDLGETPFHLFEKRSRTSSQKIDWSPLQELLSTNEESCSKYSENSPGNNQLQSKNKIDLEKKVKLQTTNESPLINQNDEVMETEEFCFTGNPAYKSSGLKTSLHGVIYQLQLLVVFLHRATKMYESIFLATELDQAEKFDDVVLKYKQTKEDKAWTWRFVQAKHLLHVEKDRIKKNELFCDRKTHADKKFSLHKYFDSFCKIKEKAFFEGDILEEFTICTNTYFDDTAKMYFTIDNELKHDKIIFFKNQNIQKYKLNSFGKDQIEKVFKSITKKSPKEKHLKEFLDKFRFVVNYPNRHQLNRLITNHMGKYFGLLNSDLATNTFKNDVLNWFMSYKDQQSEFLLIKDGRSFLKSIKSRIRLLMTSGLSLAYPETLNSYFLEFSDIPKDLKQCINNEKLQILNLITDSSLLSSIKVNQYLRQVKMYKNKDSIIFLQLKILCIKNIRDLVYDSFSAQSNCNLLIIDCDLNRNIKLSTLNSLYSQLLEILGENCSKKIILIGNSDNKLSRKIIDANSGIAYATINDTSNYASLNPSIQTNILKNSLYFQGRQLVLKDIINVSSASLLINSSILVKLLKGIEIRIDDFENMGDDIIDDNYVKRTLSRQLITKKALGNKNFLNFNIVVVSKANLETLLPMAGKLNVNIWTAQSKVNHGIVLLKDDSNPKKVLEEIHQQDPTKNIYWLEYQNDNLIWKEFIGDAAPIRKYIVTKRSSSLIQEEELLEPCRLENKVNILAADPGFGKSSLMSSLNKQFKALPTHFWTKHINLLNYVSSKHYSHKTQNYALLGDIDFSESDTNKAISFLSNMLFALDIDNEQTFFQKSLFELSLQSSSDNFKYPEIILIFDGFDEISPNYKPQTLILLKALRNSNVTQLWVTTRIHEKHSLEEALKIPALHLNPFSVAQRHEFVEKYASQHIKYISQERSNDIYNKLCSCLEHISLSSNEHFSYEYPEWFRASQSPEKTFREALHAEFTNVPLHLRMLIKVSFSGKLSDVKQLDLPLLYKEFVTISFNEYYDKKSSTCSGVPADEEMRERDIEKLINDHACLAFELLFPHLANETVTIDNKLARIGFVLINTSRVQFTHRSFAEYFVVHYLRRHVKKDNIQQLFCDTILVEPNYILLRSFINENEPLLSDLMNGCKDKIRNMRRKDDLYFILKEKHGNIIKAFLKLLRETGTETLADMEFDILHNYHNFDIRTKSDRELLILLNIAGYDQHLFSVMFSMIMNDNMNIVANVKSPLQILMNYYTGPDISEILDHIYLIELKTSICNKAVAFEDMITKICNNNTDESLLHVAAKRGTFNYIKQLIMWIKQNLFISGSENHFVMKQAKKFYVDIEGENISIDILNSIIKSSGENVEKTVNETHDAVLSRESNNNVGFLNTLLHLKNWDEETFLHIKNYNTTFDNCLHYLFQQFEVMEMKKLCGTGDSFGRTILHYFVRSEVNSLQNNPMKALLQQFNDYFDIDTIREILFKVDHKQKTALHYHSNTDSAHNTFGFLLSFSMNIIAPNVFRDLLLMEDHKKKTILHNTVKYSSNLKNLLNYLKLKLDLNDIKKILFRLDIKQRTALHLSVKKRNSGTATLDLLNFTKQVFGDDLMRNLLFAEDNNGMTVLHHSCYNFNGSRVVKDLLNYAFSALNKNDFQSFVYQRDSKGKSIFHHASCFCEGHTIQAIFELWTGHFGMPVLNEVILETDARGQTILHNAAENLHSNTIKTLLDFVKNNMDINTFTRFLLKKNKEGKSAFEVIYQKNIQRMALEAFGPSYNWLIYVLRASSNDRGIKSKKTFKIYWTEVDLLYGYAGGSCQYLPSRDLKDELSDILNTLSDHPSWQKLSNDEWVLNLEYSSIQ